VEDYALLLSTDSPLREAITHDRLRSIILWGPPGTGKTTLARVIANATRAHFIAFSAVLSGIKEIREVMAEAEQARRRSGSRTILFIDEIHRFNKAQQDAFLPRVESGDIVLIGATTENPSFEVNAALLSRSKVFVLKPLGEDAIVSILRKALTDVFLLARHGHSGCCPSALGVRRQYRPHRSRIPLAPVSHSGRRHFRTAAHPGLRRRLRRRTEVEARGFATRQHDRQRGYDGKGRNRTRAT